MLKPETDKNTRVIGVFDSGNRSVMSTAQTNLLLKSCDPTLPLPPQTLLAPPTTLLATRHCCEAERPVRS